MKTREYKKGKLSCQLWSGETGLPLLVVLDEPAYKARPEIFISEEFQEKHSCSVLWVQSEKDLTEWEQGRDLHTLLLELEQETDGCRMYLVGGAAAWAIGSRFPRRFAGVLALGGRGDPYVARNMKFTPVWAFGQEEPEDRKVPASPKHLVAAVRTCGGQYVRYTSVSEGDIWSVCFENDAAVEWLFRQDRKNMFEVSYLCPGLFRIDDYFTSSAYLICGTEKALLIDTGLGEGDLPALVKSLTPLPVEVAVTHPHEDHMAQAYRFPKSWFHRLDIESMEKNRQQMKKAFGWPLTPTPKAEQLCPIEDGTMIDLGGGVQIEAVELGGHTPNSVVFIDRAHKCIFTGDAIGSGFIVLMICGRNEWRQVISHYKEELGRFIKRLPELEDFAWYGGHFIQENGCDPDRQEDYLSGQSSYYLPLSGEIVRDMEELCEKLLSGEIPEETILVNPRHYCEHKSAGMTFKLTD